MIALIKGFIVKSKTGDGTEDDPVRIIQDVYDENLFHYGTIDTWKTNRNEVMLNMNGDDNE